MAWAARLAEYDRLDPVPFSWAECARILREAMRVAPDSDLPALSRELRKVLVLAEAEQSRGPGS